MLKPKVGAQIVERLTAMRVVLERVVVSERAPSQAPLVASLAGGAIGQEGQEDIWSEDSVGLNDGKYARVPGGIHNIIRQIEEVVRRPSFDLRARHPWPANL